MAHAAARLKAAWINLVRRGSELFQNYCAQRIGVVDTALCALDDFLCDSSRRWIVHYGAKTQLLAKHSLRSATWCRLSQDQTVDQRETDELALIPSPARTEHTTSESAKYARHLNENPR
jgi:hypothetical protein